MDVFQEDMSYQISDSCERLAYRVNLLLCFELNRELNCDAFLIRNFFSSVAKLIMANSDAISPSQIEELINKAEKLLEFIEDLDDWDPKDLPTVLRIAWFLCYFHDCRLVSENLEHNERLKCKVRPLIENALIIINSAKIPRRITFTRTPHFLAGV